MRIAVLSVAVCFAACSTANASQGGATFRPTAPSVARVPLSAMFAVCWPTDALSGSSVKLTWLADDVVFEVSGGATNSTGRCLREIASSVKESGRAGQTLDLTPPAQPIDGWGVLEWVKVLSASRFGAERGVLDPAPLVRGCLSLPTRAGTSFTLRFTPDAQVRVVPSALTDAERCVEAVLGSTAWPAPRELFFSFQVREGPSAVSDVQAYVAPTSASGVALDPTQVKEAVHLASGQVGTCWNEALQRRPSLNGARTLRFRVSDAGVVERAWVAPSPGDAVSVADFMLDRCLVDALKQTRFSPSGGDGFFTWVFAVR